jgi:hypothetical protein
MLRAVWELMADWLGSKWADSLSDDHRDDPVYRQNFQDLIERSRNFEEESHGGHS